MLCSDMRIDRNSGRLRDSMHGKGAVAHAFFSGDEGNRAFGFVAAGELKEVGYQNAGSSLEIIFLMRAFNSFQRWPTRSRSPSAMTVAFSAWAFKARAYSD